MEARRVKAEADAEEKLAKEQETLQLVGFRLPLFFFLLLKRLRSDQLFVFLFVFFNPTHIIRHQSAQLNVNNCTSGAGETAAG